MICVEYKIFALENYHSVCLMKNLYQIAIICQFKANITLNLFVSAFQQQMLAFLHFCFLVEALRLSESSFVTDETERY